MTDVNGNSAKKSATVTVEDNIDPEMPNLTDITWSCGMEIEIPTTTDNCSGEITATTTAPLQYETFGEYIVPWTFEDPSGNSITVNQKVIIPEPTVNKVDNINVCNGENISGINFTASNVAGTQYKWTNSQASIGLAASGSGNIASFSAVNNSSEIVIAEVTVTPVANNCEGVSKTFTITVNPTPTITKPSDISICAGETVEEIKFPGAAVSGTSKSWTNDNTNIGLKANGNGKINSFTATNTTNESIFATISVTPSANGCEGIPESFTIEVKPEAKVEPLEDFTFCNGVATTAIALIGLVAGTKFDVEGGASIGLSNKSSVTEIPSFTPFNNSASPVTAEIRVTPKANGCTGEPEIFSISVNPTPNISISPASQALCSGETTSITFTGAVAGTSYNWTVSEIIPSGSITGGSDGSGDKLEQTLRNTTGSPAKIIYKVTPEANGCTGTPIPVTVTVNPLPELFITDPEPACSPAIVDLTTPAITEGSTPGLTFTYWEDQSATRQLQNPDEAGPGTYYIMGATNKGCSVIKPVTVTENPTPQLSSATQVAGFCSGTEFNYEFSSDVADTQFNWSRKAISGISTPANNDTGNISEVLVNTTTNPIEVIYEVTLISPSGCINSAEVKTTVTPAPLLSSTTAAGSVCSGTEFNYTPTSETSGTVFNWTRPAVEGISNPAANGTGSINEVLENTTNQPLGVTYQYTLSSNNCENPQVYNVTVTVTPAPDTEVSAAKKDGTTSSEEIEICVGESIDLFSETSFPSDISLPSEISNSNFNNGAQGWTTEQNNNNRSWNLADNGEVAYIDECEWWEELWFGCVEETVNFHSNDNSRFYLVNSNQTNGSFNNVSLISPVFSTEGYNSLELSFWHVYRDGGGGGWGSDDRGYLEYRTQRSNGSWRNWTTLDEYRSSEGEADDFANRTYSLSNLISQRGVQIRFRYDGANQDWYWAVDNVNITGDGAGEPQVQWTADTNDWTSNQQNPEDITPNKTTIYTATYTDPDTGCPGSASVKVIVRQPPNPSITANYCGDSKFIELSSDNEYKSYLWESGGEVLGSGRTLDVEIASTYTLTVTDGFGCVGTGSINVSRELIVNGDFENGATGFYTEYRNRTNNGDLYPEGDYAVDTNASDYHGDFSGRDHTSRNGNFMIVNGHPGSGKVIWRQTIEDIQPNTNYYFNAWGMNVNPKTPARLQFRVNGQVTGTVADLRDVPVGQWVKFYSNPFWNSGNATSATLEIINLETIRNGNDFGLDDISFGTLEPIIFSIDPSNNSAICEGDNLELYANIKGGREPIEFEWSDPEGNVISTEENPVLGGLTSENAGIYTLKVTDFYGCAPQTATTEVNIIPQTEVDAGDDLTVCAENTEIQLGGKVSGSVNTGYWSGGNGSYNPGANVLDAIYTPSEEEISTGIISLILNSDNPDAPCEPVQDTLNITINPSPVIENIQIVPPSCFSGSNATATVSMSSGKEPFTYLWSDGQTGPTATGLGKTEETDNLFVTVTDANGCSVSSENIIIEEPAPLEIVATEFSAVTCFGANDGTATIEVSGGFLVGSSPQYNFQLLDSEGAMVYTEENVTNTIITVPGLITGNYTFSVSTPANCTSITSNITITQPEEIIADAGEPEIPEQCGITSIHLNAVPVDENLGTGEWHIISGQEGSFEDASLPNTLFFGKPGTVYELEWVVTPSNSCPDFTDTITVEFPESCSQLDFDGEDDYVDLQDETKIDDAFSIEAWVKPHTLKGINTIIAKRERDNLAAGGFDLIINNGKPSFRINNKSIVTSQKISTERWFHLAAVFDGSKVFLYVDGVEMKTGNASKPKNVEAPMLIGAMLDASSTPTDLFHGWIEELRIWNKALAPEQLRFMMNQRLEKVGNNGIRGSVLQEKVDIPGTLEWNNLSAYYQLIADPAKFINGKTEDLSNSENHGILKNIQSLQENTAPLPYVLYNSNKEWYSKSTWQLPQQISGKTISRRDVWDAPNSLGIDNQTKIDWNIVKIENDIYNPGTPNNKNSITLLGLLSEDGKFDMQGENNHNGSGLTITHYLKLNGIIDLNGESQLIQSEGSILDPESSGYIQRDQQGTQNSYNYNYWSSPVSEKDQPINSGYSISAVLHDGTDPSNPKPISFEYPRTYADGNYSGNLRISSYWLNIFHGTADEYGVWKQINATTHLEPGTGYTMKGTSGSAKIKDLQNYIFEGKPNNGTIRIPISQNENRLVGNPYPSVIDASEFIKDNLKDINGGRNSKNIFNGTLYFWDHFGQEDTHVLAEYIGGYAAFNLAGSVPGVSNDRRINSNGNSGTKLPGNGIPVAQGFFVNTIMDQTVTTDITVSGGEVVFKNSQRTYVRENPGNSQFLRPENFGKQQKEMAEDTRTKIRLNFVSPTGYHRQILATADVETTNDFDLGYDAPMMDYNAEDMFWMIKNGEFVIQAVKDFGLKRTLPLGLYISEEKEFEISIESLENLPENFEVFIRDNETETYHNLSEEKFTASLPPGYYTTRFDIVFSDAQEEEPGEDTAEEGSAGGDTREDATTAKGIKITYNHDSRNLRIDNPEALEISEVMIFDLRGRLVEAFEAFPSEKRFYLPVKDFSSGIYIVKMIYDKGIKNMKIIIR